jgi:hypothetical protein
VLQLEDDLLSRGSAPAAILDRPGDVEPAVGGELLLPGEAQLPVPVVGRSADAAVPGELAHEVVGEPVAQLLAERLFLGCEAEVHPVLVYN